MKKNIILKSSKKPINKNIGNSPGGTNIISISPNKTVKIFFLTPPSNRNLSNNEISKEPTSSELKQIQDILLKSDYMFYLY